MYVSIARVVIPLPQAFDFGGWGELDPTVEAAEAVKWSDGGFCLQNLQQPYHSECLHSDNALKSRRSGYFPIPQYYRQMSDIWGNDLWLMQACNFVKLFFACTNTIELFYQITLNAYVGVNDQHCVTREASLTV